jgi:hypothetical protein
MIWILRHASRQIQVQKKLAIVPRIMEHIVSVGIKLLRQAA